MKAFREWMWMGLAIGAVWAFRGIEGAAITLGLAAVGGVVGVLVQHPGEVRSLLAQRDDQI